MQKIIRSRALLGILSAVLLNCAAAPILAADPPRRNVVLFVADGLRHGAVDTGVMPTFAELRKGGVNFVNSHALFPTVTTPNASAIATGHYLGDTGDFSNTLFTGFPQRDDDPALAVEDNINIATLNAHFGGNYLGETSFIAAARQAGMHTAILGKHGPALLQDVTLNNSNVTAGNIATILIDDATGAAVSQNGDRIGVPLPDAFSRRLANDPYFKKNYFDDTVPEEDPRPPGRQPTSAGSKQVNVKQQKYMMDVLTRAVLPDFVSPAGDKKPFAVVFWSRDPDGTQHNELDVSGEVVPGINGPTTLKAFENVDGNLKDLLAYLRATPDPAEPAKKLSDTTDIFITSDHGFSTISRGWLDAHGESRVDSFAIQQRYPNHTPGEVPGGMIAIDLAHDLDLPLYDGGSSNDDDPARLQYKKLKIGSPGPDDRADIPSGPGLLGGKGIYTRDGGFDAALVVVGTCIYAPNTPADRADPAAIALVRKTVASLASLEYISGIFVDTDRFGAIPGALSFNDIYVKGSARTPVPAIITSYRSFSTDPADPYMTGVTVSNAAAQGQGTHGCFGRQDTYNCMIAFGPDFKSGFTDPDPVSNADIALTLGHITGIDLLKNARGKLHGRVITEALTGGPAPRGSKALQKSSDPLGNVRTYLQYQEYTDGTGTWHYFDAAGFPNATVGLTVK